MAERVLLAIDRGTTRLKVAAFDEGGRLMAREAARNEEHRSLEDGDKRLWQDPDQWWVAAADLTRHLLAHGALDGYEVGGIGLSARAGGFAAIDADGELSPRHGRTAGTSISYASSTAPCATSAPRDTSSPPTCPRQHRPLLALDRPQHDQGADARPPAGAARLGRHHQPRARLAPRRRRLRHLRPRPPRARHRLPHP
jgi:hypothetical protein